jgi:acetyl esterase
VCDLIVESGRPPFESLTPAQAREVYLRSRHVLQPEPAEVAEAKDLNAEGPAGPIPLRLYRGLGTAKGQLLPAFIYFHGGGFVLGDLDSHDQVCRAFANAASCAVVAVDYRLAPEHKFPACIDDAVAATRWIADQAQRLGIDGKRLAVGGDSAGGNLAAVVALEARDHGPRLSLQVLIYPTTDLLNDRPSHQRNADQLPLKMTTMHWFIDHYLRSAQDKHDWRASPLLASSLKGTPPALVITAEFDPLLDEGDAYAEVLAGAGVRLKHERFTGQIHGFLTMGRFVADSARAIELVANELKTAFAKTS